MTHTGSDGGWRNNEQGSFTSTTSDVTTIKPTMNANLERGVGLGNISSSGKPPEPLDIPDGLLPLTNFSVRDQSETAVAEGSTHRRARAQPSSQHRWSSFMPLYQGPTKSGSLSNPVNNTHTRSSVQKASGTPTQPDRELHGQQSRFPPQPPNQRSQQHHDTTPSTSGTNHSNQSYSNRRGRAPIDHGLQAPLMCDDADEGGYNSVSHNVNSTQGGVGRGSENATPTGNEGFGAGNAPHYTGVGRSMSQGIGRGLSNDPVDGARTGNEDLPAGGSNVRGGREGGAIQHGGEGSPTGNGDVGQGSGAGDMEQNADPARHGDMGQGSGNPPGNGDMGQNASPAGNGDMGQGSGNADAAENMDFDMGGPNNGGADGGSMGQGPGGGAPDGTRGPYGHKDYIRRDEFRQHRDDINRDIRHIASNVVQLTTQVNQGFQAIVTSIESKFPETDNISQRPPSSAWRKAKVPKETSLPIRRSHQSNAEAKAIRNHLSRLVGAVSRTQTVSEEESIAFAAMWSIDEGQSCGPCCTPENFRIDLNRDPTSPWNKSAAKVFFRSFIEHHKIQESGHVYDTITARFFTRIKTLKAEFKTRLLSAQERAERARKDRRAARKKTLFASRLEIAETDAHLRRHIKILGLLGVRGMSSDESDSELVKQTPSQRRLETPITNIVRPRWRSNEVTLWLRTFDAIYHVYRRSQGATRGAWPHLRRENADNPRYSNNSTFVWGLPNSAYDHQWLESCRDAQFSVRPSAEEYHFVHDPALMNKYLRQI